jgi:hypothetical protein
MRALKKSADDLAWDLARVGRTLSPGVTRETLEICYRKALAIDAMLDTELNELRRWGDAV